MRVAWLDSQLNPDILFHMEHSEQALHESALAKSIPLTKLIGRPKTCLESKAIEFVLTQMARGLTLSQACAAHDPILDDQKVARYVGQNKEFQTYYEQAKAKRIIKALDIIDQGDTNTLKRMSGQQWQLERVYRSQFGRPDTSDTDKIASVVGVTLDILGKVRAVARGEVERARAGAGQGKPNLVEDKAETVIEVQSSTEVVLHNSTNKA